MTNLGADGLSTIGRNNSVVVLPCYAESDHPAQVNKATSKPTTTTTTTTTTTKDEQPHKQTTN